MSLFLSALLVVGAFAEQPNKRPSDEERGKELWERHCTACHGPANRGDGPATEALVVEVPDLRDQVKINDAMMKLVLRGRGAMPGYETSFDKNDARRVLKYMATVHEKRAKPPAKAKAPVKTPAKAKAPDEPRNEDAPEE